MEETLHNLIVEAFRKIHDPEIPVNIYDLGLIYGIEQEEGGTVVVRMTLTTPACPVAGSLVAMVEAAVRETPGVEQSRVELVWEPPWSPEKMTETGRMLLELQRGVTLQGPKLYNLGVQR